MKMRQTINRQGYTMVELLIVVSIVGILVALALPSYTGYARKANRGEAQQLLLNWANNQELWRATHTSYADGSAQTDGTQLAIPTHPKYNFFIRESASSPPVTANCAATAPTSAAYTLVACPKGDQANDEDEGVACNPLTLDQSNSKTPSECW